MKLFCKHNWKLLNQITVPSEFDMLRELGYESDGTHLLDRLYITDYCCDKCGTIKRYKQKTLS